MYCIEESTGDIFGTFLRPPQSFCTPVFIRRPRSDSVLGELCPACPPVVAPLFMIQTRMSARTAIYFSPERLYFGRGETTKN